MKLLGLFGKPQPPQPSSVWKLYSWGSNGLYTPTTAPGSGDLSSFVFPIAKKGVAYPAFLTTTADAAVIGNLTGKTLSATLSLAVTGNPSFRYGGQGVWNNCQVAPNTRLFISTSSATYNLNDAGQHEDSFWWSHGGVATISAQTGTMIIGDTFAPDKWTNANGHSAADPAHTAAFNTAVASVRQVGLSLGGGCYFDVGIAVLPNTGTATFHLTDFKAQ